MKKKNWVVFDLWGHDFECVETEECAHEIAKRWLDDYRDHAPTDGWPEDMTGVVGYAEIKEATVQTKHETKEQYKAHDEEWPYYDRWDEICDYELQPVRQSMNALIEALRKEIIRLKWELTEVMKEAINEP